jgi:hypothetical protein
MLCQAFIAVLGTQASRQCGSQYRSGFRTEPHQPIEIWRRASSCRFSDWSAKKIGRGGDVENLIANGDANARWRFPAGAKHAER